MESPLGTVRRVFQKVWEAVWVLFGVRMEDDIMGEAFQGFWGPLNSCVGLIIHNSVCLLTELSLARWLAPADALVISHRANHIVIRPNPNPGTLRWAHTTNLGAFYVQYLGPIVNHDVPEYI